MRRFVLTLLMAAIAVLLLSEYRGSVVTTPTGTVSATPPAAPVEQQRQASVQPEAEQARAPAKPAAQPAAIAAAPAKAPAKPAPQTAAATPAPAETSTEQAAQDDAEDYAGSHTTSSASAGVSEAEFAKLSLFDLKSAVQRELARLGCYDAKVDGLWGRKSQAAVRSFNTLSGARLNPWPSPKLARVLRAAPDEVCADGLAEANGSGGKNGADKSKMPRWIREARLASADPKAIPAQIRPAAPSARKTAKARNRIKAVKQRRRDTRAYRTAEAAEVWIPRNWPGTAR